MDKDDHQLRFAAAFQLEGKLAIPKNAEGATFAASWEGQAFAIAVKIHEEGHISWPEFAHYLSVELARPGGRADGRDYYTHWLKACEKLLADKALLTADEISQRCTEITHSKRHHHKPGQR